MVDIKTKHPSLEISRKHISLMRINNIILELLTRIILLSSFVIYFFCIHHLGGFLIIYSPNFLRKDHHEKFFKSQSKVSYSIYSFYVSIDVPNL